MIFLMYLLLSKAPLYFLLCVNDGQGVQGPAWPWPWRLASVCTGVTVQTPRCHQGFLTCIGNAHGASGLDVLTVTLSQVTSKHGMGLLSLNHKLLDSWWRIVCHHFCSWDGKEWLQSKPDSHLRLIHLSSHPRPQERCWHLCHRLYNLQGRPNVFGPASILDADCVCG